MLEYIQREDDGASMSVIVWRGTAAKMGFQLRDGLAVQLTGKFDVYKASGKLSFVASRVEVAGEGLLRQQVGNTARVDAAQPVRTAKVAAGIHGDLHQPRLFAAFSAERGQTPVGLEKRLLHRIFCQCPVAQIEKAGAKERLLVPQDQTFQFMVRVLSLVRALDAAHAFPSPPYTSIDENRRKNIVS